MIETVLRLLAGVALILANAFFVVTEFALTRLRQFSEDEIGDEPGIRRAWAMTEELEIYLTGCQLGITSSSILLGVVAEPAVTAILEAAVGLAGVGTGSRHVVSVVVSVVLINLVHKIWGEQAPTYLGVERPLGVLRRLARPLDWWTRATKPVIMAGDGLAKWTLGLFGVQIERSWTEAEEEAPEGAEGAGPITSAVELRQQMRSVLRRGDIRNDRRREILNALEIQDIPIRKVMVPRDEVVVLSTERGLEENLATIRESPYARFPLVGTDLDDVRGTVYLPSLFRRLESLQRGELELADVASEPLVLDAELPVSEAIDRFQEARQELAFVREDGRVAGVLTATDAFEAITGELEDPLD